MKFPKLSFFRYGSMAGWLVTLILTILVFAPFCSVLIQVAMPGIFFGSLEVRGLDLLLEVFRRPFWQRALKNSLLLSVSTAFFGTILGVSLAIFRSRFTFPTAKWLDISIWLLFISPSFIIAQGWVLFSANNGVAEKLLHTNIVNSFIFSPSGLVFIMTLSNFPLAYLTVHAALKWQVEDLAHAARLSGASLLRTWFTIHLPLLKPATISGFLLVFMDTIGDFGLPSAISSIYRFPTLPYAIYTAIYTSPIRFDMAGVLSFYLVLIILAAVAIQFYFLKNARYDSLTESAIHTKQVKITTKSFVASAVNIGILLIIIGIPIGSTVFISFVHDISAGVSLSNLTFEHYINLFSANSLFISSLLRSLRIALFAALIGLLASVLIAYVLTFDRFRFKLYLETISLVSLAVPGVVLGIGYIFFWNQKWLESLGLMLYGTSTILIVAAVASSIPILTRIITGTMASVPRTMLDVAQLQGHNLGSRILSILLPLCKSAFITAALTAFGASMFDLAVNSILYPTGKQTLPVMINKAFEQLQFGYASAATILSASIVTIIIVVAYKVLHIKVRNNYGE